MAGEIVSLSRSDARAQGLRRYYTGMPCKYGHVAERLVSTANCTACVAINNRSQKTREAQRLLAQRPEAKEAAKRRSAKYHKANRERILVEMRTRNKRYYEANREKLIAAVSAWQRERRPERNAYQTAWQAEKKRIDPQFAALMTMRKLVARTCERIKADRKQQGRTIAVLGYSAAQFRDHIARQFTTGMTWANHGEWHVDHIIPLSAFDLLNSTERSAANALSNLRPMWAAENMKKSDEVRTLL